MTGSALPRSPSLHPYLLLAAFGLLYGLCIHAYYVGFFNDDAFYIIGARSLLQGRYVELHQPGEPPLLHHMPGYAAFLAPIAALTPASFVPYQILSIVMVLLWLLTFWKLLETECSSDVRWAVWIMTAVNPLTASFSGTVMSDIPFALVTAVFFYALKRHGLSERPHTWMILAALAVLLFQIRPVGALAGAALLGALATERRWKAAGWVSGTTVLLVAPYFLQNFFLRGYLHPLAEFWSMERGSAMGSALIHNVSYYGHELFVRLFFRWPAWRGQGMVSVVTVLVSTFLVIRGAIDISWTGWKRTLGFFLLGYCLIHLSWSAQATRYFFPLLPFILWCFFQGLVAVCQASLRHRMIWGGVILSLILSAAPIGHVIEASWIKPNPMNTPPLRTYAWVRTQTHPQAVFVAALDGRFYLYTQRPCFPSPKMPASEGFRAWLAAHAVRYVVIEPEEYLISATAGMYRSLPGPVLDTWLAEQRGSRVVFEDTRERTRIYDVSGFYNSSRPKKR